MGVGEGIVSEQRGDGRKERGLGLNSVEMGVRGGDGTRTGKDMGA